MNQPISKPFGHDERELVKNYTFKDVTIKKGLYYNGASFPPFLFRWLRPFDPEFDAMSVVHDAIYQGWTRYDDKGVYITRKAADDLAVLILKENNVSKLITGLIYAGIRMFGLFSYKRVKH